MDFFWNHDRLGQVVVYKERVSVLKNGSLKKNDNRVLSWNLKWQLLDFLIPKDVERLHVYTSINHIRLGQVDVYKRDVCNISRWGTKCVSQKTS